MVLSSPLLPRGGWRSPRLKPLKNPKHKPRVEPPHLQPPAPFSPISLTPLTLQQQRNLQCNTKDKPRAEFPLSILKNRAEKPERLGQLGQCWQQQPAGTQRCQQRWKNSTTALGLQEERAALINSVFPPPHTTVCPALSSVRTWGAGREVRHSETGMRKNQANHPGKARG